MNLDDLENKAIAAQSEHPGPWWWDDRSDTNTMRLFDSSEFQRQILKAPKESVEYACYWPPAETATFIATFHPGMVLELIAKIRELSK